VYVSGISSRANPDVYGTFLSPRLTVIFLADMFDALKPQDWQDLVNILTRCIEHEVLHSLMFQERIPPANHHWAIDLAQFISAKDLPP
jgi:hypothetical protein